ncbi:MULTISPECIES: molecular chaperone DnaJ [unclassified Rhodococcus (in: high G+C Gram-positive bacteria)]|uniref:molecular chaperone DnaJ n=1 Tax=unclassified Rhodococcus (in: high G+C Gram-positive bacteria) TaxID=192944 RepID=UPI00030BE963|nr:MULTISPECIES: molecular chaperone DnaJ [unclassified Rhodococcus (in: high G+C Gram-positive bacteria)]MBC2637404.1 molecular chaperone DnaJ [Rhodococcus sp. 3A]MBC2898136.1 molecular chaperone DnaJ [Rhodococcus sp. 4CII]
MTQQEWIERDFYADLGVPSTASAEEIKRAYRKLARQLHPDANPGDAASGERFKSVSEAHAVLSDPATRTEYDRTRRLYRSGDGAFSRAGTRAGAGARPGGGMGGFDFSDLFGNGGSAFTETAGFGDVFGDLFRRAGTRTTTASSRRRRGSDVEVQARLPFRQAVTGVVLPLQVRGPTVCTTCHGSGTRPGTHPRRCPSCGGSGTLSRNQGGFGFSESCDDCRGTGVIVDNPCADCQGTGVGHRTRTINVRIPPGVTDGERIRLPAHGEPGLRGAPAGDLYVAVTVVPDAVFGRDGDDLTVTVPVGFGELALGTTVSVPALDGRVSVKIPAGTPSGRTFRLRGRGVPHRSGPAGDLRVTVQVTVPTRLDRKAVDALRAYEKAEKATGFDHRASWPGRR